MPLQPDSEKILAKKDKKYPYVIASRDKTKITIMACKNASSHVTTPCVIFQQKKMVENHLRMGEVLPDTYWNVSDSGGKPGRFLKTGLNMTHSTYSCCKTLDFNCY